MYVLQYMVRMCSWQWIITLYSRVVPLLRPETRRLRSGTSHPHGSPGMVGLHLRSAWMGNVVGL